MFYLNEYIKFKKNKKNFFCKKYFFEEIFGSFLFNLVYSLTPYFKGNFKIFELLYSVIF